MRRYRKHGVVVIACMAAVLGGAFAPATAFAQDHGGGEVRVTKDDGTGIVSIGNDFITRTFTLKDGKWSTSKIENKRIDGGRTFVPQEGSEDFIINFVSERGTITLPSKGVDGKEAWRATLTNREGAQLGQVGNLFDGDSGTYVDQYQLAGYPMSLVIDLGEIRSVGSFSLDKRPGYHEAAYGKNGTMGRFELYVSDDGADWAPAGEGEFTEEDYNLHEENGLFNVGDTVYANFDQVYETRYVKIVQLSDALGNTEEFSAAEIGLFSDQMVEEGGTGTDTSIQTSELTVASVSADDENDTLRVEFEPIEFAGTTWQIAEVTAMEDGAHYMNSHLEIKAADAKAAAIDYIDTDSFVLPGDAQGVWSIPDESQVSSMWIGKHELMLGQPIYVDGLFMGSEFPAAETDILDDGNTTKMRYYSGKTIAKMAEDEQDVIVDGDAATFRTWSNVVGAAQGVEQDVVQTDFFSYIEDIATPSAFRKQYNSWFDNMLNITPESVERSFLGAEKGLAENGVEPIDSYVVDDGWNNYNSGVHGMADPGMSGTTPNKTGFWEFNSKWPNELYDSTSLAHKFQSTFGMWVGPRGGYNYPGNLGHIIQDAGTGFYCGNSGDVCTGSRKYIKNYEKLFLDYQQRFDIDYWKWDGFAWHPCTDANHDHMVGGPDNMYFTSDMWEAWTDLFEAFREDRGDGESPWINATCYVNPSPWLLQWVNTVWLQDSADTAQSGNAGASRHQQKIYYRDHVYSNIFKNNDLQFPLKNVYNHDPIYGVSDGSDATTEDFREFMFDNAMRGTAFWELYYSPSIMNEAKWQVNADALDFAERNHEVLKNAKLFASEEAFPNTDLGASVDGVYGYSAWNGDEGIVSFVNPTGSEQTYTLRLDNLVGVPTGMKGLAETRVFPYAAAPSGKTVSYGDELTVTLEPHSSLIYQYGAGDTRAPEITSAKIVGEDTVRVVFNTRMSDTTSFKLDGKDVEAGLTDDYRTFELKADGLGTTAELSIEGAQSVFGVGAAEGVNGIVQIGTAGEIAKLKSAADAQGVLEFATGFSENPMLDLGGDVVQIGERGISGTGDFSIEMAVRTASTGTVLASQGADWKISIDEEGYAVFSVGELSVSSKHDETTVTEGAHGIFGTAEYVETQTKTETFGKVSDDEVHTLVATREPNGMVKLYLDGELAGSAYADGVKADLAGGAITVGSENLAGYISGVAVRNSARYYDDASTFAKGYPVGRQMVDAPQDGWTAKACSEQGVEGGDGPASYAIDGDPSTWWHSSYGGADGTDGCTGPHTLTIDFGGEVTFDNLVYTGRPNGGNGDWEQVKIVGIAGDASETVLRDMAAVKLDENREVLFAFDEPQTFSAVRFEIEGAKGYATAAEIRATNNVEQVDTTPVDDLRSYARGLEASVNEADYTVESYKAFAEALDAAYALNPFDAASAAKVDGLKAALDTAFNALAKNPVAPGPGDKSALEEIVGKFEGENLDASKYTGESWGAYQDALAKAKAVLGDPAATQEQIDRAVNALSAAYDGLMPVSGDSGSAGAGGDKPGTGGDKPGTGGDKPGTGGAMPQTGDTALAAVALASVLGTASLGAGALMIRKKRGDRS